MSKRDFEPYVERLVEIVTKRGLVGLRAESPGVLSDAVARELRRLANVMEGVPETEGPSGDLPPIREFILELVRTNEGPLTRDSLREKAEARGYKDESVRRTATRMKEIRHNGNGYVIAEAAADQA